MDAKKGYYRKKIHALRSSNPKSWYKNIKSLIDEDLSDKRVEVEDIKDFSDEEQCEMIADKFAEVSNRYEPLRRDKIIFPAFSKDHTPPECVRELTVATQEVVYYILSGTPRSAQKYV